MMNLAPLYEYNPKQVGSYLRNFNLALLNWELNRKEDREAGRKSRRAEKSRA
ncbi:MAG: hypothetical protein KF775_09995 [Cyclobacteriaceae bacterium]|nr:hypothetical protein [Cytophagales bacterium]MBX2899975.1 hypothetical protein [Cyclobacteriaceae bacterium]